MDWQTWSRARPRRAASVLIVSGMLLGSSGVGTDKARAEYATDSGIAQAAPLIHEAVEPIATSSSDSAVRGDPFDHVSYWSDDQIKSLASATNSSIAEAAERVDADEDYAVLVQEAKQLFPTTFGGYEIRPTGRTALTLFFTQDAGASVAHVHEAVPDAPRVKGRQVEHSEAYLEDLYAQAIERNQELISPAVGEMVSRVTLNRASNEVEVRVDSNAARAARASAASQGQSPGGAVSMTSATPSRKYVQAEDGWEGLQILAETNVVSATQCVDRNDCKAMRGGINMAYVQPDGFLANCSMSYTGYDRNTGAAFVVTNAHCGRGSNEYWQGVSNITEIGVSDFSAESAKGTWPGTSDPWGFDAVRVPDQGDEVGIRPWVYESGAQPEHEVFAVGEDALHLEGRSRCYSGYGSHGPTGGPTCGLSGYGPSEIFTVDEFTGQAYYVSNSYMFDAICASEGDSGGPVYNGPYLDGHVFAVILSVFDTCTFGAGTYYGLVADSARELNLRVLLSGLTPCQTRPPFICEG